MRLPRQVLHSLSPIVATAPLIVRVYFLIIITHIYSQSVLFSRINYFMFRGMLASVVLTYLIVFAGWAPTFFLYTIVWRFDPLTQRSMAFLVTRDDYAIDITIPSFITTILTAVVKPTSVLIVVACSVATVLQLRRATKARSRMRESQLRVIGSEVKITRMLLFLSLVYIVCSLPNAVGALTYYFIPNFYMYRKYHNTFIVFYEVIFAASCLNSSSNFFAYTWLSSKFRASLQMVTPCFQIVFSGSKKCSKDTINISK